MRIPQTDWASRWAVYSPQALAFKEYESGRTLTFARLNDLGNRLAYYLTDNLGMSRGERIAVLAENCLEYLLLFVAAQKTGCVLVPLNYRLAAAEIDYLLRNAEPALLIAEDKWLDLLEAAPASDSIPHHWSLSDLRNWCGQTDRSLPFPAVDISGDDPIFILYTSGTTGFPKGALYTHKMLFWNSINTAMSLIVNNESRTVNCMPPFHTGGWNVLTTPFFHHGGFSCLTKKFDPAVVLQLIEEEQATIFMGVPTMLRMMADLPTFETADLSSLHYVIVGGEPMPVPLIEKWHSKGVPVRQGYGMTEVGPNLTSLHQQDAISKKGSIGRPNFYVDIRIVNEHGQEVATGQTGELWLRGPMVTPGYWRNNEATAKALQEGWFRTGDLVVQKEGGYLYVVDRIKHMYISGGENVYPAEVERVLVTHPDIAEAAVIGIPDEKWGESGKAFVVVKADVSEQQLIDYCRLHLAGFKVPRQIVQVPVLPKNDAGKIDRRALRL